MGEVAGAVEDVATGVADGVSEDAADVAEGVAEVAGEVLPVLLGKFLTLLRDWSLLWIKYLDLATES